MNFNRFELWNIHHHIVLWIFKSSSLNLFNFNELDSSAFLNSQSHKIIFDQHQLLFSDDDNSFFLVIPVINSVEINICKPKSIIDKRDIYQKRLMLKRWSVCLQALRFWVQYQSLSISVRSKVQAIWSFWYIVWELIIYRVLHLRKRASVTRCAHDKGTHALAIWLMPGHFNLSYHIWKRSAQLMTKIYFDDVIKCLVVETNQKFWYEMSDNDH